MIVATALMFFALADPETKPVVFIPTSQLVDMARIVARDEGWPIDRKDYYFDELRTKDGKDTPDGFQSIALYANGHPLSTYGFSTTTGDVVDWVTCKTFQYPNLKSFQLQMRILSKSRPLTIDQLASQVGCNQLKVVNSRWVSKAK